MTVLADRTFLTFDGTEWQAIAVVFGVMVSLLLGARQLRDSRSVRLAQARPYIVVDAVFDDILINISIRNAGNTIASAISVTFDEPLLTTSPPGAGWQDAVRNIGSLAPGREMRFFLDSYVSRMDHKLPMIIHGQVEYDGLEEIRHARWKHRFVIDLEAWNGALLPEKTMHDLVKESKKLREMQERWTNGISGLKVTTFDGRAEDIREQRDIHVWKMNQLRKSKGWKEAARYYVRVWRHRRGF